MNISGGATIEQEPGSWIPLLPHQVPTTEVPGPGFSSCLWSPHRALVSALSGGSLLFSCPVAPGAYCPQCSVGHRHGAPWVDLQDVTHQPDALLCPGYLSLTTP